MISDAIQLPDAPGIHGLRFWRFRARDDFNHMASITRVSAEVDDTEGHLLPATGKEQCLE